MNVEIKTNEWSIAAFGFYDTAVNHDYAGTAFRLMDRMWQTVKEQGLKNKGKNIWVYEDDNRVFAGVELEDEGDVANVLERKAIRLTKYAYFKHVGPYQLIKQVGLQMRQAIKEKGLQLIQPYIEIYGHWTNDETQLETELIMNLQ